MDTTSGSGQERTFPPPAGFAASANVGPAEATLSGDRLEWWASQADRLDWERRWDTILDWSDAPFAQWFVGGRLNVAHNCVDRHVANGLGERVALHWEGEPGDTRTITYADLQREVNRAANALESLGVQHGDRVAIYMPMIPETVFAMLACARIGAPHSVVFGGFSADALASRILDADARFVITADGGYRRGTASALKPAVDAALESCPDVSDVLVVRRTGQQVDWTQGRDHWWHDVVETQSDEHTAVAFDSEHPLFILYTSGTTGKPKGILHTTGGYLTQASWTHWAVFDLKAETDVYWCSADVGWVTGHSYIVYGPLSNGATSVMYEGTPDTPGRDRWWSIVEKYGVSILYTAPTAVRTFMKWGDQYPDGKDLSSLRLLGSVGEPINPEAWRWYRRVIGGDRVPVVDTWWQTETGSIMLTPLPGVASAKPGAAMAPLPGISVDVVDDAGEPAARSTTGYLVLTEPWPGMLRGIWGDPDRFREAYWSRFPGLYFAGDGARRDEDGDLWMLGRVDDVMNVSGHRISTAEVEHALVGHNDVVEAAVIGASDPLTGQAVVAFVTVRAGVADDAVAGQEFVSALRSHVRSEIGAFATMRQVIVTPELPKTRSGKIMRRLLRDIAEHRHLGDVTTLADPTVTDMIEKLFTTEE